MFEAEGKDKAGTVILRVELVPFSHSGKGKRVSLPKKEPVCAEIENEIAGIRGVRLKFDAQPPGGYILYHAFCSCLTSQSRTARRSGSTARARVRISSSAGTISGTIRACIPAAWAERIPL